MKFLLEEGCPSIRYRVRKEILGKGKPCGREEILKDARVKRFLSLQDSKGWIPGDFHSPEGVETACRFFSEVGLEPDFPPFSRMLGELEGREDSFSRGSLQRVGRILDRRGFGGAQTIRASIFARAGLEDRSFVREEVEKALKSFDFARQVERIEDITTDYRGKRVFMEGALWPGIYHLRLLAFSSDWKTEKNLEKTFSAIKNLARLSPLPSINVREGSQLISPASFAMHDFNPDLDKISPGEWMFWFHRMELLARLGAGRKIGEIERQVDFLGSLLQEGDGLFPLIMNHRYFYDWSPYTGLALEKDWKSPRRRLSDLSFRSLLIIFFSAEKTGKMTGS